MQRAVAAVQTGFAATGNAALLSDKQIRTYIDGLALLPGVSRDAAQTAVAELSKVPYMTVRCSRNRPSSSGTSRRRSASTRPRAPASWRRRSKTLRARRNARQAVQPADGRSRLSIETFQRHGDQAGALAVLLQALEDRFSGAQERGLTPMQKAANDVAVAWDGLMKKFADPSGTTSATNGIANLLERVAALFKFVRRPHAVVAEVPVDRREGAAAERRGDGGGLSHVADDATATSSSVSGKLVGPDNGLDAFRRSEAAGTGRGFQRGARPAHARAARRDEGL